MQYSFLIIKPQTTLHHAVWLCHFTGGLCSLCGLMNTPNQKKSHAPKSGRRGTSAQNEKKSHNSREMRNLNILISNMPNVGGFLRDGIDIEQFNIQFQSFIN